MPEADPERALVEVASLRCPTATVEREAQVGQCGGDLRMVRRVRPSAGVLVVRLSIRCSDSPPLPPRRLDG